MESLHFITTNTLPLVRRRWHYTSTQVLHEVTRRCLQESQNSRSSKPPTSKFCLLCHRRPGIVDSFPPRFLRDEDEKPTTWDDKLAGKYYESLYREFAVCDLKHYKSGNVRFLEFSSYANNAD